MRYVSQFWIDLYYPFFYSIIALSIISILPLFSKEGRHSIKNAPFWLLPLMYSTYFIGLFFNMYWHMAVLFIVCLIQAITIYRSSISISIKFDWAWKPYIKEEKEDE